MYEYENKTQLQENAVPTGTKVMPSVVHRLKHRRMLLRRNMDMAEVINDSNLQQVVKNRL
jgi:hypothetical protein